MTVFRDLCVKRAFNSCLLSTLCPTFFLPWADLVFNCSNLTLLPGNCYSYLLFSIFVRDQCQWSAGDTWWLADDFSVLLRSPVSTILTNEGQTLKWRNTLWVIGCLSLSQSCIVILIQLFKSTYDSGPLGETLQERSGPVWNCGPLLWTASSMPFDTLQTTPVVPLMAHNPRHQWIDLGSLFILPWLLAHSLLVSLQLQVLECFSISRTLSELHVSEFTLFVFFFFLISLHVIQRQRSKAPKC